MEPMEESITRAYGRVDADGSSLRYKLRVFQQKQSILLLAILMVATGRLLKKWHGSNAIILSASLDRTCKVWSLTRGTLLRNIVFPSIIDAVALDPGEHVFYAGGRDGKIYIAELNAQVTSNNNNNNYGLHIIGTLSDQSKAICSLGFALDGYQLVVGSVDGMVRVWDTKTRNIIRLFKHAKGPVNNIVVMRQPVALYPRTVANNNQGPMGRRHCVKIFSLPDLNLITEEHLGGEIIPRFVLLCAFEGIPYLLCALGDGHLLNFFTQHKHMRINRQKKSVIWERIKNVVRGCKRCWSP
ncbi:unnamed protein product [Lactuca virosa]|uniref:Uncharacterized protein n=1 Tax=Lactuca virosa TaxID=75947 RepID=A0AAU9MVR8_9ASTR|nr:unnamed protein product [Lactuca virosa]